MAILEKEVENPTVDKEIESANENKEVDSLEQQIESLERSEVGITIENTQPELEETAQKLPIKKYNKAVTATIVTLGSLLSLYLGVTVYFINHFYFGSEINCISVSAKSVQEVELMMSCELQQYTLTLNERAGKSEQIRGMDVGLKYPSQQTFDQLKDNQNPFSWVLSFFDSEDAKMTVGVTYDEALLRQRIDQLSCLDASNSIEPKNPSFKYIEGQYVIVDEVIGNQLDKELLYAHVSQALLNKTAEINLEALGCYIQPHYHSNSPKIIEVNDTLNQYVASKITYTFGDDLEVLDGSIIHEWLTVDENLTIVIDEKKAEHYIFGLSQKYDVVGRTRNFTTSLAQTIQVSGGDYSQPINKAKEVQNLITTIKQGLTVVKEPVYGQNAFSYGNGDIGCTYVEIDLTNQHIWFYKSGSLIVEGDIVTGDVSRGYTTPKGVYSLKNKMKNVVLRGPGYASPVSFWMPFNGGIGMHDANWKSRFGGDIYKTNGSHGCINCPDDVASIIYDYIDVGTAVICY